MSEFLSIPVKEYQDLYKEREELHQCIVSMEKLKQWLRHEPDCARSRISGPSCTCGLEDALVDSDVLMRKAWPLRFVK